MSENHGNGAKMRAALEAFVQAYELVDELANIEETSIAYHKAIEALDAPARVCDVLSANELKLQVFAGLAYQIKIKGLNIMGLEVLLRSVAGAVIDIAYNTNEEGETND